MAFLTWSDSLSIGVDEIDAQHQHLVGILNELHDVMLKGSHRTALARVLTDLLSYTRYHFSFEERLMVVAAYPGFTAHQRKHQAMVEQVKQFVDQLSGSQSLISIKLLEFLKAWLRQHILETDLEFARFELARRRAA